MKDLVKGRLFLAKDNGDYALQEFFETNNRLRCSGCECLQDPFYKSLRIDFKSNLDVSSTYENVFIVSKRFRDYILNERYSSVIFYPVNEQNDFFYFYVMNNVVEVDIEKSGIEFREKCNICNLPKEIIGGSQTFIKSEQPLSDDFYVTDIFWRTHNIFSPRVLVGLETFEKLKSQKFKGLDLAAKVY